MKYAAVRAAKHYRNFTAVENRGVLHPSATTDGAKRLREEVHTRVRPPGTAKPFHTAERCSAGGITRATMEDLREQRRFRSKRTEDTLEEQGAQRLMHVEYCKMTL
jgi:hypothetical protein